MKIAVIASGDPLNVGTWSGTPYFMTRALARGFPGLVPIRAPAPIWFRPMRRVLLAASAGRLDPYWMVTFARRNSRRIMTQLKANKVDLALCIGNASLSAFLAEQVPCVHVSDATVPLMRNYYTEFSSLTSRMAASAFNLDRASVLRSHACLYSTKWAAHSAITAYGAEPTRVHAIPWGANIHSEDIPAPDNNIGRDCCHIVFIGVDWVRKGGDIAVAAVRRLAAAGHKVKLHVIGAKPNIAPDDCVILHGFIDKSTGDGRLEFTRIMSQAAFLLVPTRQDCSPMIFAEANSYGIPVITTRTGGVSDVVLDGVSGHLLPFEASADTYADLIWALWADPVKYDALRRSARSRFEHVLNWDAWLTLASPIIRNAT